MHCFKTDWVLQSRQTHPTWGVQHTAPCICGMHRNHSHHSGPVPHRDYLDHALLTWKTLTHKAFTISLHKQWAVTSSGNTFPLFSCRPRPAEPTDLSHRCKAQLACLSPLHCSQSSSRLSFPLSLSTALRARPRACTRACRQHHFTAIQPLLHNSLAEHAFWGAEE